MNRRIVFIILLLAGNLFSQPLRNYESVFNTIFDKNYKVNPYYLSGNPAYLKYDLSEQLLSLKSGYYNESGEFRKFIVPGNIREYNLTASGKKEIDSSQVFNGSFTFTRKENNRWQWIFSENYLYNSPFLIGDSTTGDSRLHGIIMNAEYSNTLFDFLGIGLAINYSVDQRLKQVSPRPTSKNREFNFTGGIYLNLLKNTSLGLKASVYDDVETINYREDVGALTAETIILKFRGYDFPNVFRKKTETRYSYNNGYSAGLDIFYEKPASFKFNISGEAGLNKINVKDDAVNPVSDGFWKMNFYKGALVFNSPLSRDFVIGFNYSILYSEDWSENLDYHVLYGKNKEVKNEFNIGLQYLINDKFSAGVEAGYGFSSFGMNDYYSSIFSETKNSTMSVMLGLKSEWNKNFATFISAGTSLDDVHDNSINISRPSIYLSDYRMKDIMFYQTPGNKYIFSLTASYFPGFGGELLMNILYSINKSRESEYFNNSGRETADIFVEYRIKVY